MYRARTHVCTCAGFLLEVGGTGGISPLKLYPSYNTHAQLQQTDLWTVFRSSLSGVKQPHLSPSEA